MTMIHLTLDKLTTLRLSAMEQEYRRQFELPAMSALFFDDRMAMLVDAEWLARFNKKLKRLMKAANLREPKACLEDLDVHPTQQLNKGMVARLSDGMWIREGRNLLITESCGTGKTYLASAFGNAACRQGLKVRSFRVTRLLTDLQIGRGDGSWNRLIG